MSTHRTIRRTAATLGAAATTVVLTAGPAAAHAGHGDGTSAVSSLQVGVVGAGVLLGAGLAAAALHRTADRAVTSDEPELDRHDEPVR